VFHDLYSRDHFGNSPISKVAEIEILGLKGFCRICVDSSQRTAVSFEIVFHVGALRKLQHVCGCLSFNLWSKCLFDQENRVLLFLQASRSIFTPPPPRSP